MYNKRILKYPTSTFVSSFYLLLQDLIDKIKLNSNVDEGDGGGGGGRKRAPVVSNLFFRLNQTIFSYPEDQIPGDELVSFVEKNPMVVDIVNRLDILSAKFGGENAEMNNESFRLFLSDKNPFTRLEMLNITLASSYCKISSCESNGEGLLRIPKVQDLKIVLNSSFFLGENGFEDILEPNAIPKTVTDLTIDHRLVRHRSLDLIPSSVQNLTIYNWFSVQGEINMIPSTVKRLVIQSVLDINADRPYFSSGCFPSPSSLTELEIDENSIDIEPNVIPNSVISLRMPTIIPQRPYGILPDSIKSLIFFTKSDQKYNLDPHQLPPNLTHLRVKGSWALPTTLSTTNLTYLNCTLPRSLLKLEFLKGVSNKTQFPEIPDRVQHLKIGGDDGTTGDTIYHSIPKGRLPSSIETLKFHNFGAKQSLEKGVLPPNLKHLSIINRIFPLDDDMGKIHIPNSVQEVHFSNMPKIHRRVKLQNYYSLISMLFQRRLPETSPPLLIRIRELFIYSLDFNDNSNAITKDGDLGLNYLRLFSVKLDSELIKTLKIPTTVRVLELKIDKLLENHEETGGHALIPQGFIPESVEKLILLYTTSKCRIPRNLLEFGSIPSSVVFLNLKVSDLETLGKPSTQYLKSVRKLKLLTPEFRPWFIPSTIVELYLRKIESDSIENSEFPQLNQLKPEDLPDSIRVLWMGGFVPNVLEPGVVPKNVETLGFYYPFDAVFVPGSIPFGVKDLTLCIERPLADQVIPTSVTKLKIENFKYNDIIFLPDSILELSCRETVLHKIHKIPQNLMKLQLNSQEWNDLALPPLPRSITSIGLEYMMVNSKFSHMFYEKNKSILLDPTTTRSLFPSLTSLSINCHTLRDYDINQPWPTIQYPDGLLELELSVGNIKNPLPKGCLPESLTTLTIITEFIHIDKAYIPSSIRQINITIVNSSILYNYIPESQSYRNYYGQLIDGCKTQYSVAMNQSIYQIAFVGIDSLDRLPNSLSNSNYNFSTMNLKDPYGVSGTLSRYISFYYTHDLTSILSEDFSPQGVQCAKTPADLGTKTYRLQLESPIGSQEKRFIVRFKNTNKFISEFQCEATYPYQCSIKQFMQDNRSTLQYYIVSIKLKVSNTDPYVIANYPINLQFIDPLNNPHSLTISNFNNNPTMSTKFSNIKFYPESESVFNYESQNIYGLFEIEEKKSFFIVTTQADENAISEPIPVLGNLNNAVYLSVLGAPKYNTSVSLKNYFSNQTTAIGNPNNYYWVPVPKNENGISAMGTYFDNLNERTSMVTFEFMLVINPPTPTSLGETMIKSLNWKRELIFPYGILGVDLTLTKPIYYMEDSTILLTKDLSKEIQFSYLAGTSNTLNLTSNLPDKTPPLILSIESTHFTPSTFILVVKASDDISGVKSIRIGDMVLDNMDLFSGTSLNGIYSKEFPYTFQQQQYPSEYEIVDNAFNVMKSQYYFDMDLKKMFKIPYYLSFKGVTMTIESFTDFKFTPNDINISSGDKLINCTLQFKINEAPTDKIVIFSPIFNRLSNIPKEFYGGWDPVALEFRVDFQIPPRLFTGKIDYYLTVFPFRWHSSELSPVLQETIGVSGDLLVKSDNADELPPLITEVIRLPVSPTPGTFDIGWRIVIEDLINGLDYGEFNITSTLDPTIHTKRITPADATLGNPNRGTYIISMSILSGTCYPQEYSISSILLVDKSGHSSVTNSRNAINPLFKLPDAQKNILSINVQCPGIPYGSDSPEMVDFQVSPRTIDLSSANREINFKIVAQTVATSRGLSVSNLPIVYIETVNGKTFKCVTSFTRADPLTKKYYFQGSITLPYMYEKDLLLLSVYGLVGLNLRMKGYSSHILKGQNLPYFINTTINDLPVIESVSKMTPQGGWITINGRKFGGIGLVMVDYGKGFNQLTTVESFGSYLVAKEIQSGNTPYTVCVAVGAKLSNIVTVDPSNSGPITPTPTSTPTQIPTDEPVNLCRGTPLCSGRGTCDPLVGCACENPWYGPSCSSKIIVIPPEFNHTTPTTVIDDKDPDKSMRSIITIVELRELGYNNKILKNYTFSTWKMDNYTDTIADIIPGGTKIQYTTYLNNEKNTSVRVTTTYYPNATLLDDSKTEDALKSNTLVGVNIPFYSELVVLDPNFQSLVDINGDDNNEDGTCNGKKSSSSGLNKQQIAGIVVGSAVGALVLSLGLIYLLKKKYSIRLNKKIQLVTIK
eukprot:gene507-638_t